MSSASSTSRPPAPREGGIQPWQFFLLLSMAGATWAVIVARDTHPVSLLLLSAGVLAAGIVGAAMYSALAGFFGVRSSAPAPMATSLRADLEREKALVLRSIKELEFDRSMKKISDADYTEIGSRLRAKAMDLIARIDTAAAADVARPGAATSAPAPGRSVQTAAPSASKDEGAQPAAGGSGCPSCGADNDTDARFCKACGHRLAN
jgi:hypothetical protein